MNKRMAAVALPLALVTSTMGVAWSAPETTATPTRHQVHYGITVLDALAGDVAFGAGINNRGLVTGTSTADGGTMHAVLWRGQQPRDLGTLGDGSSSSAVLWPVKSDGGVVVGVSQTNTEDPNAEPWSCSAFIPAKPGYTCVGFLWKDGRMRALPTLGGPNGFATGANNRGQIVGWAENTQEDDTCTDGQILQFRAVRWVHDGRRAIELPPLDGDPVSAATAVNDHGRVVGISGLCDQAVGRLSAQHAVVWDHGQPRRLPDLGGLAWNTPMSINQRGDAVGFVNRSADDEQSIRPEPVWWTAGGVLHPLTLPTGYTFGQALGINTRRQIVGVAYSADFTQCTAILWRSDRPEVIQTHTQGSDVSLCSANDINDRGEITGQATDPDTGAVVAFTGVPIH